MKNTTPMFSTGDTPPPIEEPTIWRWIHGIAGIVLMPWKAIQVLWFKLTQYSVAIALILAILTLAGAQYASYRELQNIAFELRHFKVQVIMPTPSGESE